MKLEKKLQRAFNHLSWMLTAAGLLFLTTLIFFLFWKKCPLVTQGLVKILVLSLDETEGSKQKSLIFFKLNVQQSNSNCFPFQLFIFQNTDIYRFIIKFGIILKFNRGLSTVLAVLKKTQPEKGEPKKGGELSYGRRILLTGWILKSPQWVLFGTRLCSHD